MQHSARVRIANWREDESGLLRVTAIVLMEGVYSYSGEESEHPDLAHLEEVREYIPASEFTDASLTTLEGKDVTIPEPGKEHEWRTPDVAREDKLSVGAVAGKPCVVPNMPETAIQCDFVISDAQAIADIKAGKLVEVSAGYTSELVAEEGVWNGIPYNAVQKNFQFNHILLLPKGQGRCGPNVRIINNKGLSTMSTAKPVSVEVKIGNSVRTYRFTNQEDKDEAERMNSDTRESYANSLQDTMNRVNELTEEIGAKNSELESEKAKLIEMQAELERILSPEAREELAEELSNQKDDETEIVNQEIENEAERENIRNQIKNSKTMSARRQVIVAAVMRKNSIDTASWKPEQVDGAFTTLAIQSRARRANAAKQPPRVPMGGAQATASPPACDPRSRVFNSSFGGPK